MSKDKIKIAIIGAGPCGTAAAIPFLSYKDKIDVSIISSGESLYTDEIVSIQENIRNRDRKSQHEYIESINHLSKTLIPKKLFFGSNKVYKEIEDNLTKSSEVNYDISHSLGGLSNVWGATVTGISDNDLANFDYNNDISLQFQILTKLFPISGYKDKIDSKNSYNINYNSIPLKYCFQAHKLVDQYNKYYEIFEKNNLRIGYSKLAVNTNKGLNDNACDNSGLEMFGCHKNSIFNSIFFLKNIQNEINLIENTLIEEITPEKESVILSCKTKDNCITQLKFDYVIIAAGTINTSKLILKLLNKYNKNSLIIKDSQKYFFLYFSFFKSKKEEEKNIVGLSQIFMQTEIESHTFQLQLYHSSLFIRNAINRFIPRYLTNFLENTLSFVFRRIMIGVVYFPEEISNHMKIVYDCNNKFFRVEKLVNEKFSNRYIFKLYVKLIKLAIKIRGFPLPFFLKSQTGVSQHFGSTVPPSKSFLIGKTSEDGKLYPLKNVYVSDSSSLNRISSTPPTYIAMSNALRISNNIIKEIMHNV